MKITLDIDPSMLGSEVAEFIKTLTPEDKNALVKQVVGEYYSDYRKFEEGEKTDRDKEWLSQARRSMSNYDKPDSMPDEQVRLHYQYKDLSTKFKTFSQTTREEISQAIRKDLTERINTFVKEDVDYQNLLEEAMKNVKELFPMMVQQAMIAHMSSQLPNLQNQIYTTLNQMSNQIQNVEQKLIRY